MDRGAQWHRFERDGTELACLDFGGPEGAPAVLFLHGLAGYGGEWDETAGWLSETRRVLALDERGHGESTRRPADVSREAHVADVAHVIGELGVAPVTLVGQSAGAHLAFIVAARHPRLVSALVVVEATPYGDPDPAGSGAEAVGASLERWPVPFPDRGAAEAFFGGPSLFASAWSDGLEAGADGLRPRFDIDVMVQTLREAMSRDYWDEWEQITCPTLVVRAGAAAISAEVMRSMAQRIPNGRYAEIEDAKHDLHLDRPVEWRGLLEGFLAEL